MSKARPDTPTIPFVPAIFSQTCLEMCAEHGLSKRKILQCAGLTEREALSVAGLSLSQYERLLRAIRDTAGDMSIGMEMGWRLPPTSFGNLGTAILSSATLGDALSLCQRFWGLYGMGLTLAIHEHDGVCALEFQVLPFVDKSDRATVLEAAVTSMYRSCISLLAQTAMSCDIWFDFPAPSYASKVRSRLESVRYNMPSTQLCFPATRLKQALVMANVVNLRLAVAQCEREVIQQSLLGQSITSRVQQILMLNDPGYPSLGEVAQLLNLTSRTLRRRLDADDMTYMDLLNLARARDAKVLLRLPGLEIQQIAEMLGYKNPANFTRAFRQWTGVSPKVYRLQRSGPTSPGH